MLTAGDISRPVDCVRLMAGHGVPLKKAHDILNRIAAGAAVPVELRGDPAALADAFGKLGVSARPIVSPQANVKQIRERLGLSQAEFATLYSMELDTLQNWEQGRYKPDRFANLLLKLIEQFPHVVEAVVTESTEEERRHRTR